MFRLRDLLTLHFAFLCAILVVTQVSAADTPAKPPEILDEPKTVDPASLVPETLAVRVTVDFAEASLREIAQWIQENQKIPVLFDATALSDEGIPLGEPVVDRLKDAPLYLLLNRLRSLGLAWYMEDGILHVTTTVAAEERLNTRTYNLADLLDAGYEAEALSDTILHATSGPWSVISGAGGETQWLGEVQVVRHTE
jgi:hypothetical protein